MATFSQQIVIASLMCCGCRSAPEPPPAPIPKAAKAQAVEPAAGEPSREDLSASATQAPHVYDEHTSQISARVGERFEVALPGNITTPLKWSLEPASMADLVTLSTQSYSDAPPQECAGCVGYPGTARFVLDAAQEGTTTLRFAYRKLGQSTGQAKRELDIKLTVTP